MAEEEAHGGSSSNSGTDDDADLDLVFRDKKCGRYCLVLQEFDGKGVFIMRNEEEPDEPVLGLPQIVHFIRRREKLLYPHTIRDILREYVEDVSIFEDSLDRMNLVTSVGVRVNLSDPPITLFGHDRTVTLYLQNKTYLSGDQEENEQLSMGGINNVTRREWLMIFFCTILLLLIPYFVYCLITWDQEALALLNPRHEFL